MGESMQGLKRTCYCGEVNETMIGQTVTLMGWVNRVRELSKLYFITLRDRSGIVQVTLDGNNASPELMEKAGALGREHVIAVTGKVMSRGENINEEMKTGKIELDAEALRILSPAAVTPFHIGDADVANDLRLKYRYLDLRRGELQENFRLRHKVTQCARNFLSDEGFLEIETPMLAKSTPEGARDYLVPSRIHQGRFYALPQSPQQYKQLLMVSGFDKYFQIVRCFRDEDLRADRQPEFTQIDMELSFVDAEDVIEVNERLMARIFKDVLNVEVPLPFPRISYKEAMERFGSDKPDNRFGMELCNLSSIVAGSEFMVFESALQAGGSVRAVNAKGCGSFPRKQIDSLIEFAKTYGAKGLTWISINQAGEYKTSLTKFFTPEKLDDIVSAAAGEPGDLILICADKDSVVFDSLGALRVELAKRTGILEGLGYSFLWVTEFPLLEWSEEDDRFYAKHHPFTSPMEEDLALLETDPAAVRAKAYDMVLNGNEIGGGSIRIHQAEVQERMFKALGFTPEASRANFGFMLDAFQYGAPPHGGLAYGLDRIIMLMTGSDSIRDVIAFPKVKDASCPMTEAPGEVSGQQLEELGLELVAQDE